MSGKIIGIGGIFLKFKDPKKMNTWYSEILGLTTNEYGVLFTYNQTTQAKSYLQLGTFPITSDYFGSATQQSMLNFRVDDLTLFVQTLRSKNVVILDEMETYDYGKFIHINDPEGNKIELWEPVDNTFINEPSTEMN